MSSTNLEEAPPPPPVSSVQTNSASDIPAPPPPLPAATNVYSPDSPDPIAASDPDPAGAGISTPDSNMTDPDYAPPPPAIPDETPLVQQVEEEDDEEEEVAGRDQTSPAPSAGSLGLPQSMDIRGIPVLKEGWLKKKAGPLGISRKRYCVLYQNGILRYYTETDKSEEHRKGKGDVSFQTIKSTTHDGKKFTVENENKVWQFEAEDFVEAADWLAKFELPGRAAQNQTRSSGYSMSTSMTLEAYGEDERMVAQKLHTL